MDDAEIADDYLDEDEGAREAATYVTFDVGAQTFAADVADVREILDMQEVSPLPNASRELVGMIDVRGEGIAVIDLVDRLGLAPGLDDADRRIIVVELDGPGKPPLGVLADRVRDVVEIPTERVDPAPKAPGGWDSSAIDGVTRLDGRIAYLLSLRRLLGSETPGPFDFS